MYNQDIYNKLEEKFEPFNMPLLCQGIAEMYKLLAEEASSSHLDRFKFREFLYEADWWGSAIKRANNSINK